MTVDIDRLRELSDAMLIEKHFGGDEPEPEEEPFSLSSFLVVAAAAVSTAVA